MVTITPASYSSRQRSDVLRDEVRTHLSLPIPQIYPTGKPYFYDDFERTNLAWTTYVSGSGAASIISTMGYMGQASMRLQTTAVADDAIEVIKKFGRLPKRRIGLEFLLHLPTFHTIGDLGILQFGTEVRTPTVKSAYFYYDPDWGGAPRFAFSHKTASNVDLIILPAAKPLQVGAFDTWYPIKLIVDLDTSKYVAFLWNNILVNLETYNLYEWSSTETWSDYVAFLWLKNGATAKAQDVRIDNVIGTYGEPTLSEIERILGLTAQSCPVTLT